MDRVESGMLVASLAGTHMLTDGYACAYSVSNIDI